MFGSLASIAWSLRLLLVAGSWKRRLGGRLSGSRFFFLSGLLRVSEAEGLRGSISLEGIESGSELALAGARHAVVLEEARALGLTGCGRRALRRLMLRRLWLLEAGLATIGLLH